MKYYKKIIPKAKEQLFICLDEENKVAWKHFYNEWVEKPYEWVANLLITSGWMESNRLEALVVKGNTMESSIKEEIPIDNQSL